MKKRNETFSLIMPLDLADALGRGARGVALLFSGREPSWSVEEDSSMQPSHRSVIKERKMRMFTFYTHSICLVSQHSQK